VGVNESAYHHHNWTSPNPPDPGPNWTENNPELSHELDQLRGAGHVATNGGDAAACHAGAVSPPRTAGASKSTSSSCDAACQKNLKLRDSFVNRGGKGEIGDIGGDALADALAKCDTSDTACRERATWLFGGRRCLENCGNWNPLDYTNGGISLCVGACIGVNISTGGVAVTGGGIGFGGWGYTVGATTAPAQKQGKFQGQVCVVLDAGGCFVLGGQGNTPYRSGYVGGNLAYGEGVLVGGTGTVASVGPGGATLFGWTWHW
jgi:hypothetical protein